jgi:excisionase family DNA binding protein
MDRTRELQEQAPPVAKLLLRVEEVAQLLEIGRTRVYHLIASGELASVKIGGSRRVPTAAVHRYVAGLVHVDAEGQSVARGIG